MAQLGELLDIPGVAGIKYSDMNLFNLERQHLVDHDHDDHVPAPAPQHRDTSNGTAVPCQQCIHAVFFKCESPPCSDSASFLCDSETVR